MADTALIPLPLDGTLLERPLPGSPPVTPEGGEPDARLDAVTTAVTRGEYANAARAAEALLREGVHDARLIGPYLFGAFQEQGLAAMAGLFRSIHQVLTVSLVALGPVDKRDVFLDAGLRWLLRTLNKHLVHQEKKQDATWQRWCEPDCRAPLEEALALAEPILTALSSSLPKNGCEEPFRTLTLWLSRHLQALPQRAPLTLAPRPDSVSASEPASEPAPTAPAEPPPANAAPAPSAPTRESGPGLPISPALVLLLRKLEAFGALLERGELAKAGVVATDVLGTVEHFDPRVYLPALFTPFFSGLSTHAQALEPLLQDSQSLPMRALEQLYRVDLDAFLALPTGGHGSQD
ncbi:type VI secretion system protein IglI family protein [Pyxidicoccus sp. 3LFB2]